MSGKELPDSHVFRQTYPMASTVLGGDVQREVEVRQGRVITQVIDRPSTTFTTYVTLGGGPPPPPTTQPTTTAPGISHDAPTVAPVPSTTPQLTNEQIGAILGSVFGFVLLLLLLCTCLSLKRRRRMMMYDSSSTSEEEVVQVFRGQGQMGDPWRRPARVPGLVPPPTRIPPTPRHTPYRQTRHVQIRGVRRYP
ncbi:hypothetical protein V8F20_012218 [Naviculisporaceae sp. PSN 640]